MGAYAFRGADVTLTPGEMRVAEDRPHCDGSGEGEGDPAAAGTEEPARDAHIAHYI